MNIFFCLQQIGFNLFDYTKVLLRMMNIHYFIYSQPTSLALYEKNGCEHINFIFVVQLFVHNQIIIMITAIKLSFHFSHLCILYTKMDKENINF